MIFDSTFYVLLHREIQRGEVGPMRRFMAQYPQQVPGISEISRGELARGFTTRAAWIDFCEPFVLFPFTDAVAWRAALIFNDLRRRGVPTGENDLWIAATALEAGETFVTRNVKHFREIRGLKLLPH